ncbi:hypothetical protein GGI15_004109 [Coemansia interrupta]|uniref:Uncharacterized protein n=1 Tax=Coemansia interrupta TaxID=1126814 RepID=A0A9W8HC57_9FUNG|nr:hypothetical protein GGI15_004109 [Coemansia interrupta]
MNPLTHKPRHALRRLARSTHKNASNEYTDITTLQTTSAPHPSLPPAALKLRQKIQSNPHVKQLTSGQRKCLFSNTHVPKDLLLRIKSKRDPRGNPQTTSALLCIDELESYSGATGKSAYLPLGARGLYAALTDPTIRRTVADIGRVRPDIVEHCARVLRLRVISGLHRVRTQMLQGRNAPEPREIPPKGQRSEDGVSRLDAIRAAIRNRVQRQDAQWLGSSPFIALDGFTPDTEYHVEGVVLPAAGLQCILRVPRSPLVRRLSTSSEADAHDVFDALLRMQQKQPADEEVLDQAEGAWTAHVVGGSPMRISEPTLSTQALVVLYGRLSKLFPDSISIADDGRKPSKRKERRMAKQSEAEEPCATDTPPVDTSGLTAEARVSYEYSLRSSGSPMARPDGRDTKAVPVYDAAGIFGRDVAATVVNWLLLSPASPPASLSAADTSLYVGIVAMPCTVDLAAQLSRLSVYLGKSAIEH